MSIESPARAAGRASSRARGALAAVGLLATAICAGTAAAHEPSPRAPVTLGEVSSDAAAATGSRLANIGELLRRDAEVELSAIDWSKAKIRRRLTVSAALVRLSSARVGERSLLASCTVSAAVRDAERGTLLVIVEGRARAEDAPSAAEGAERDALAAAVRGAITALPEAIQRAQ